MHRIRFLLLVLLLPAKIFSQNLDVNILQPINRHPTWFKDHYLELCASSTSILSISAPLFVITKGIIEKDKVQQRDALFMAGGLVMNGIIVYSLKHSLNRSRPFEAYDFIVKRDDEGGGKSLPSGHTASAFYTAMSLSLQYKKWYVSVPAFIYAGSVGWARMYQGVHYPSDVLGGAAIGTGTAFVQHWVNKKLGSCHHAAGGYLHAPVPQL